MCAGSREALEDWENVKKELDPREANDAFERLKNIVGAEETVEYYKAKRTLLLNSVPCPLD